MAGFEDFILQSGQPENTANPASPFEEFLSGDLTERRVRQSITKVEAKGLAPDQAAEAKSLAKQTGIPQVAVESTLPDVKKMIERKSLIDAAKSDPSIAKLLQDPNALAVAKDDIAELTSFSNAFRSGFAQPVNNIGTTLRVLGAEKTGAYLESVRAAPEGYKSAASAFINAPEGEFSIGGMAPQYALRAIVEQAGQLTGSIASRAGGAAAGGAVGSVAGPGGAAVGAGAGAFAGPALFGAMQVVGQTAESRAKANGRDKPNDEDMAVAWLTAAASGSLDAFGAKYLPGGEKAVSTFTRRLVSSMYGEGATEGAQSLIEQAGSSVGTDKGADISVRQVIGEGLLGAGSGGAATAVAGGAGAIPEAAKPLAERIGKEVQRITGASAKATQDAQKFDTAVKAAIATKTIARDPETFRSLVKDMATRTGKEEVYIPAGKLVEFYQSQGLDVNEGPWSQSDLDTALAHDGDIAIPLDAYMAELAPTMHEGLLPYIRYDENSLTLEEAEAYQANMDEVVRQYQDEMRGEVERLSAEQDSSERVLQDVKQQLVAAGRSTDVAEKEASTMRAFFRTMAQRMGTDAWSTYERNKPTIQREFNAPDLNAKVSDLELHLTDARNYFRKQGKKKTAPASTDMFGAVSSSKKAAATPRPLVNYLISRGGIDRNSVIAQELAAMDITPKNTPRLFKAGGMGDIDNLPAVEFNEQFADYSVQAAEDGNGYVDRQWLIDRLSEETFGKYLMDSKQREQADKESRYAEMRDYVENLGLSLDDDPAKLRAAIEKDMAAREAEGELYQDANVAPQFYSVLEGSLTQLKQPKASSDQWAGIIKNLTQKGVKQEEIEWSGVLDWLKKQEGSVSKESVLEYLRANKIEVQEVVKGGDPYREFVLRMENKYGTDWVNRMTEVELEEKDAAFIKSGGAQEGAATKFDKYTLPGGENYRELLMTLPYRQKTMPNEPALKQNAKGLWAWFSGDTQLTGAFAEKLDAEAARSQAERPSLTDADNYKSSHYDEKNILAHLRFNARTDADGKRVMFIEEVQSDWHQEGRDKGYKPKGVDREKLDARRRELEKLGGEARNRGEEIPAEMKQEWADIMNTIGGLDGGSRVPDAPFKTTWPELAFKRALMWAVENNFDRVAWTTGEQQAERYDLSKQVGRVAYNPDSKWLQAYGLDGKEILNKEGVSAQELGDYIGKEAAANLLEAPKDMGYHVLSGDGLKVGGEGMKGFYDKMLPSMVNKLVKKWGGKVGTTSLEAGKFTKADDELLAALNDTTSTQEGDKAINKGVWSLDITPAMHESVMQGLPLFQRTGKERGSYNPTTNVIKLFESANLSTFLHESGHYWLEMMGDFAERAQRDLALHAAAGDTPIGKLEDSQVTGLQGVVDDYNAILKHLGVAKREDIKRDQHEEFARTVEAYFMEGKAPSVELQGVFQRFKSWLLALYKDIRNLRVNLNPEIKGVLDRMLATEQEIADAERAAKFEAVAIEGATPAEQASLGRMHEAATGEAERKLLVKAMAPIRRQRAKWWKEEWQKVADKVEAEMTALPQWRALALVRGSEGVDPVKLNRAALEDSFGTGVKDVLPRGATSKNGVDPDVMAEMVGLPHAKALIDALSAVKDVKLKDAVKAEADRIMLDTHGDILNDGSLEAEAQEAIHNEKRGDAIALELKVLRRMGADVRKAAERRVAAEGALDPQAYISEAAVAENGLERMLAQEAGKVARFARSYDRSGRAQMDAAMADIKPRVIREAARRAVGKLKTKDIGKTAQYSRAEVKAAEQARQAIAKRDYEQAAFYKYRQLLNHYLFIEAKAAQEESSSIVKYLDRLASKKTVDSMDQEYLEQIHGLLEQYDLKAATQKEVGRRKSFAAWVAEQEAAGLEIAAPEKLLAQAQKTHYSEIPLDDLRALKDTVKQIDYLGRKKQKLLDLKEKREYDALVSEAVEQVESLGQEYKRSAVVGGSKGDFVRSALRNADADLLKMEQFVDWLDGGKSDGIFNRLIFRRIAEAQNKENDMLVKYVAGLEKIMGKLDTKRMAERITVPGILDERGRERVWDRQSIIAAALNTGNDENLTRLTGERGNNISPEQLAQLLSNLNAKEAGVVQEVWDFIDTLWPEIEAMEKSLNGVAPPKVQPRSFTMQTADGPVQMKGGYFPIVYDSEANMRAAKYEEKAAAGALFENNYVRATTPKGHTKERVEGMQRPLRFDLAVIPQHIGQVIHDLAYREAVMDVDRFTQDARVANAVKNAFGPEYAKMFRPWLQSIANDRNQPNRIGARWWEQQVSKFRANATVVGMGFRVTTMMAQISGASASIEVIGSKWMGAGLKQFYSNPREMYDFVMERSGEIRNRSNNLDRDIRDGLRKLKGDSYLDKVKRWAFVGIAVVDKGVAMPTWLGAYNKALSEGMADADAVYAADKAVRLSQGAGAAKDLSAIQRGNELMKLFTMFYSYFNVMYARQRDIGRSAKGAKTTGDFGKVLARSFWLMVLPSVLGELIVGRGPEDDEDEAKWVARKVALYPMMSLPFVRNVGSAVDSGYGFQVTPAARGGDEFVKLLTGLSKLATDEDVDMQQLVKTGINTAGYFYGLPAGQFNNTAMYLWDLADGDADPEGVLDAARGLTMGPSKK